jgi:hypothetical protein
MITERKLLQVGFSNWTRRANSLGLKGKARERDCMAFLEGLLIAAIALGAIGQDRANQLSFLVNCGRLDSFFSHKALADEKAAESDAKGR